MALQLEGMQERDPTYFCEGEGLVLQVEQLVFKVRYSPLSACV